MKRSYSIPMMILTLVLSLHAAAQGKLELYEGNEAYRDGDFAKAEELYDQALSKDPANTEGAFNRGNATYRQENYTSATEYYQRVAEQAEDPTLKAQALHNLGNTQLQAQKFEEAVKSYKNALRLNPQDDDTRYNLAYAQRLLKQQQQQEQKQDQQQDQQDKEDQQDQKEQDQQKQDKKDDQEKDNESSEQDKQDKDKEKQEKEQQQDKGEQNEDEAQQQKKPKPIELSPREAEQMLEAAKNQDQKLQMQLRKQKGKTKNIDKDW